MSRIFTCGFEETNSATNMTAMMWSSVGGSTTIASAAGVPHSGTYYCSVPAASNGPFLTTLVAYTGGTMYTRFYFRISVASSVNRIFFRGQSTGGTTGPTIQWNVADSTISLINNITPTTKTTTTTYTTGLWYRAELRHLISDTVGELELRLYLLDSTSALETLLITAEDTKPVDIKQWQFAPSTASAGTWLFDDIAINRDDASGFQDTWPGPGKTALMKPAIDVAVSWTSVGGAGTNSSAVGDAPATPDDTTYNEDSGTTNVDQMAMSSLPVEVPNDATMILTSVQGRTEGAAASQTMIFRLWNESGTPTDGPSIAMPNGVFARANTTEQLVFNTTGKTAANVMAFNIGYKGNSGVSAKRVSVLWMNVEWLETPAVVLLGAMLF